MGGVVKRKDDEGDCRRWYIVEVSLSDFGGSGDEELRTHLRPRSLWEGAVGCRMVVRRGRHFDYERRAGLERQLVRKEKEGRRGGATSRTGVRRKKGDRLCVVTLSCNRSCLKAALNKLGHTRENHGLNFEIRSIFIKIS
jgi:hypothetical protein